MRQVKKVIALILVVTLTFSLGLAVNAADRIANVTGTVVEVQKYGNLTMDIKPNVLYRAGYELGDMLKVKVGSQQLEIPFCTSYSDVDTGNLVVRDDKENNLVVVAINMGNFSTTYDANKGDKVTFSLKEKKGYLSEYLLHQLKRSNDRSDYALDSVFANFRNISTNGINPGVLYRSSSPVNNEIGRAAYSDALAKAVGINAVLNLADSKEDINQYFSASDFESPYYKSLYYAGKVKCLNMGVDLAGEEFGQKFAEGLRFLIQQDGPYLIHCTEGKDRAGFASAVLEALMGASIDEIVDDYMVTYQNYYNVQEPSEQYSSIASSNIMASMTTIVCGQKKGSKLTKVDLAEAAQTYLAKIGLTSSEIEALKTKLTSDSFFKTPNVTASVTEIQKYGHATTNIPIANFYNLNFEHGDMATVVFDNGFVMEAPFIDGYYVENGEPLVLAYPGHETISICINYGKLNEIANINVGDRVTIMLTEPQAYLHQYKIRKLVRTNNREDYDSDAEFANFRMISMGNIADNVLYRSSSPVNNELGRASYSDKLIKAAGVQTVINLADSDDQIIAYRKEKDFASPYYLALYRNKQVLPLNMGLAYESPEFKQSVIQALTFMSENKAPYLIHCTEGKDRCGFFSALLESLMGATKDEIVADYMQSYINYFGVETGSEQYDYISKDIIDMLKTITKTNNLDHADLAAATHNYLLSGGMTEKQIQALKANLSAPQQLQKAA